MAEFTYPANVFDRPQQLLATLGSFWSRTYLGEDQVLSLTLAAAQVAAQTHLDLLELVASMSRFEVPIWHRDNWYMLLIKESELNGASINLARFDGALAFDDAALFDTPQASPLHAFPLPDKLVNVPLVMNRITDPTVLLTDTVDFTIDNDAGAIVFRANPFDNPLVAVRNVYEDGEPVDREAALWLFRGEFDYEHIYRQFGYVLGLKLKSSKGYRDIVNAIMDNIVQGPTAVSIEQALAAMAGVPLVQEATETVEAISSDANGQLIITDRHVYRYSMRATATVAVGDVVRAGQSLVDAFEVIEFNRGQVPDSLQALAIGRGLLANCFYGDLIFDNKDVPLEVDESHESGYTYLKFGLGGFPADVTAFFDEMHLRGMVAYESRDQSECAVVKRIGTLAHMLDKRTNPDGEPRAANLPATINPLKFLVENVLRNNAYVVKIKVAGMGPDALGLYNVRHLRRIIPPHTAMILLYEFVVEPDTLTVDLVSETSAYFAGVDVTDTIPENLVQERKVSVRMISGTCQ